MLDVPGYDAKTGLYFDPGRATFPKVKDRPTKADALAALEVLKRPLADFPFADEDGVEGLSRSVALAGMLTSVCRRVLPIAPAFGVDAHLAESGKTELAQVTAIMMTGRRTAVRPLPHDEYQRSAALAAALEAGDPMILYDNVVDPVEGAALCAVITDEVFKCRRLGGNGAQDQVIAPTNSVVYFTGNKLKIAGDMADSRVLLTNLRPDRPLSQRSFAHWPLVDYVKSIRTELVAAALTILRAHAIADDKVPGPYFRFAEWRRIVADALVWLGEPDPVLSVSRAKETDPVREAQESVVRAWLQFIGPNKPDDGGLTTAEVLNCEDVCKAIAETKDVPVARITAAAVGRYLSDMVGVEALGYKLKRRQDRTKVARWLLLPGPSAVLVERDADKAEDPDDFLT